VAHSLHAPRNAILPAAEAPIPDLTASELTDLTNEANISGTPQDMAPEATTSPMAETKALT